MTTLIEVRNSEGVVGRCDAKCHNAKGPECDCICGGVNHGVGLDKARANTMEWLIEEAEAQDNEPLATFLRRQLAHYQAEHGLKEASFSINEEAVRQLTLW